MSTRPYGEAQKINGVIANDLYQRLTSAEHQRDKALEDHEQAMHRVAQLETVNESLAEILTVTQKYHSEAAANLADAVAGVLGEQPSITDTEEGIQESLEEMRECQQSGPDYDAQLIADILDDYAHLQETGAIEGAGRYFPADAREQAELITE